MAGNDILKALAVLSESGIKLTSEQETALANFKSQAMRDAAETILSGKVGDKRLAGKWVTRMFDLAGDISAQVKGANVGRGRGEVHEKMFRIETPHGSLKVSLTTEPVSE